MNLRMTIALATLAIAIPAQAGELSPEQAKLFVAGKNFAYSCFEGTTGTGRINADGSVVGTIRLAGTNQTRYVALPSGTIRVQTSAICASVRGIPVEPCFTVTQTGANSFRGSIVGMNFAYCNFYRRNPRLQIADKPPGATPAAATSTATAVVVTREDE